MGWFKKLIIGFCTLAAVTLPTSYFVQKKINRDVPLYVRSHLEEIMHEQEKVLGIKHFGIPKISFEPAPSTKDENFFQSVKIKGEYISEEDKIYLPLGLAITPEKNLTNILAECLTLGVTSDIKVTLDHELGHYYTDKLNESLGKGDWLLLSEQDSKNLKDIIKYTKNFTDCIRTIQKKFELTEIKGNNYGRVLISEGIAVYFERRMNEKIYERPDIYEEGFHFVKPIIDRYGKEGIGYLITNPPTIKEIGNLGSYKSKIMKDLSNSSKPLLNISQ